LSSNNVPIRELTSGFASAEKLIDPFPVPEAEETILSHGADEVTVQEQADAVPRTSTDRTLCTNPMWVDPVSNTGLQTKPAWFTGRICRPISTLQLLLFMIKFPVRGAPMLSVVE
jgi:hypothetical protein